VKRFRIWTAGLLSRVDWMVSQVENHEALAQGAIAEVTRAAARARVQLVRVREDGARLRRQLGETHETEKLWRDRARRTAAEDEARALECLRRSKRAERRAAEMERRVDEHERAEKQLAQDVAAVDERLGQLKEKRNLLRTRESRAQALATVRSADAPFGCDVGELFDRWEAQVTEREFAGECASLATSELDDDAFEDEFVTAEENENLRAELDDLLREAPEESRDA